MYKHDSLVQKNHAFPENNILPDIYSLTCLVIWFGLPDSALWIAWLCSIASLKNTNKCYLVNLVCLGCCVVCLPEFSVVLACLNNIKIALIFLVEKMHRLNMIELFLCAWVAVLLACLYLLCYLLTSLCWLVLFSHI